MPGTSKLTARAYLAACLAEQILARPQAENFRIASEHELCRRYNISRVTVRLALGDLEARGLIYRQHGKGTFAFGRIQRKRKPMAILRLEKLTNENWTETELRRGFEAQAQEEQIPTILLGMRPAEWPSEVTGMVESVAIFPQNVTPDDISILRDRKLPFLFLNETSLPGPCLRLNQRNTARLLTEQLIHAGHQQIALLSGFDPVSDLAKRQGINDALNATSHPQRPHVSEFNIASLGLEMAIDTLLRSNPRPTAVVAFDDTFACTLIQAAQSIHGLQVPGDLSVVAFNGAPFLAGLHPEVMVAKNDYFAIGQGIVRLLRHSVQTGLELNDINIEPTLSECALQHKTSPGGG